MALLVTGDFETAYGTVLASSYWRWVGLGVDVSLLQATVTLYGYVDASAFAEGKLPVGSRQFTVSGEGFLAFATALDGESPQALSVAIYEYVRAQDEWFTGAVDV